MSNRPPSDLERIAAQFRATLMLQERAAASEMVRAYGAAYGRIRARLDALTTQIAAARQRGDIVNRSWLLQEGRYILLQQQVQHELVAFGLLVGDRVGLEQAAAIDAAQLYVLDSLQAALPGVDVQQFALLPRAALEELVGTLQDGSPLRDLLDKLGTEASQAVQDALITGLAVGEGPRALARRIRQALGGSLVRALTISRTEVLRASREAVRRGYAANTGLVQGWIWFAARNRRTCAMCWAMHGTLHPLNERFASHPNCRCTMLPLTRYVHVPASGVDDFRVLPVEDQEAILGRGKYAAYRQGKLRLPDLVGESYSTKWGPGRYERSLREVRL